MIIVDAHEDLAWNIKTFERDYSRSAGETRRLEAGSNIAEWNGDTLLGWPDYQLGQVALVFCTLFASPIRCKLGDWDQQTYKDDEEAHQIYSGQLDAYYSLVEKHPDKFSFVQTQKDLEYLLADWGTAGRESHAVGLLVSMEGAEAVRSPQELELWWQRGVRIIGPAWAGNRYCGGTGEPGPLSDLGYQLLDGMAGLGFTLDLSHMDEKAALSAIDYYPGQVIATHANPAALLKESDSNRHLPDLLIQRLVERDGVIGVVLFNHFLDATWQMGDPRDRLTLDRIVEHIDYICQGAGDAWHVGIGTDFDGGFGWQSVPEGIDSIADLAKLAPKLQSKGYSDEDVQAILGENWLRCLKNGLPLT